MEMRHAAWHWKLGARGSASLADEGVLKEIDRKVKLCRNPVYDPTR